MNPESFNLRVPGPVRGRLQITENFFIATPDYPNAWWRFWHWALLGWRWSRVNF